MHVHIYPNPGSFPNYVSSNLKILIRIRGILIFVFTDWKNQFKRIQLLRTQIWAKTSPSIVRFNILNGNKSLNQFMFLLHFNIKVVQVSDSSHKSLKGHEAPVLTVALDPDEEFLVNKFFSCLFTKNVFPSFFLKEPLLIADLSSFTRHHQVVMVQ